MSFARTTTHRSIPAWPVLAAVQVVALATLGGIWWGLESRPIAPPAPLEQRLLDMDVPHALMAIEAELEEARNPMALRREEQGRVASFLSLAAQSAGLSASQVRFEPATEESGLQWTEAVVDFHGDVFDLPIFLDSIHRQRAVGVVQWLDLEVVAGGQAKGTVRKRYSRPAPVEGGWISERLEEAASGVHRSAAPLELALELRSWRVFNQGERKMNRESKRARARVERELPHLLVQLRESGGRLTWSRTDGASIH
ncbi:MAG: hypothetical protein QGG40_16710 [Myxococcota bacterium]|nr:hypothetical protein [Myxococcota bacterium]